MLVLNMVRNFKYSTNYLILNIVQKQEKIKFLIVTKFLNKILLTEIQLCLISKIPFDEIESSGRQRRVHKHINITHYNNQVKRITTLRLSKSIGTIQEPFLIKTQIKIGT